MKIKLKTKEECNITKYVEYKIENGYYHYPSSYFDFDYIFIRVTDDYVMWVCKWYYPKIFVKKILNEDDIHQILCSSKISKKEFEQNYKKVIKQFYTLRKKSE